jgi:hypothetical protein
MKHNEIEKTIVRCDEELLSGPNADNPSVAPHSRVDHARENCRRRTMTIRSPEQVTGLTNIVRSDIVGDIDDRGFRIDGEDNTLHRPDIMVGIAEIGQQRYGSIPFGVCDFSRRSFSLHRNGCDVDSEG